MRRSGGLTKSQIVCIVALWVALCIILFTVPSDKSMGENIFYMVFSGIIIFVAIKKDQDRMIKRRRRDLDQEIERMKKMNELNKE